MEAVRKIEARLGEWVIASRWPIIAATLILVAIAASGGRFLEFSSDYRVFFSEDNPQLLAFEALEDTYTRNDNVLFAVVPNGRDATSARALEAIAWLTERAWQTPFSTRVDSIANFQHTTADGDDLIVRDLVDEAVGGDAAERSRVRAVALAEPRLAARLIATDGAVGGVNVTVQMPGEDETLEVPQVVEFVRGLAAEVRERFPGIDVRLTGMVMMNYAFTESSLLDMKTLMPVSFAVMALMLALLTRGLGGTFATMLVVALSILAAMGLGGWVGFPFTPPSAAAPTIVLTVAIANCVHVLTTLRHVMQAEASRTLADRGSGALLRRTRTGELKRAAIAESLRVNLQPIFLASLTTALGFLSMNFSDVPPFRHLGTFVAFGVGAAFLLSVTFLPALLSLLPVRARATGHRDDPVMAQLAEFVVRRRTPLLWGSVLAVAALVASIPRNELNDVFVEYFDDSVEFRRDADFTVEHLTGLYTMEYSLVSGESGGIGDPAFLAGVEAFAEWYRAQPETIHVNVITDTFRRLNMNMHGDDPAAYRLPESRDLAAQYLLLYEMSLPYGLDLNNQLDVDKSSTRMTVATETLSSNELLALDRRAQRWLAENAPGEARNDARGVASSGAHGDTRSGAHGIVRAEEAGTSLMFAYLGRRNIRAMLLGTTVALVGISLVLIAALRSWRLGLASLVPNLVPGAMGFGIWGLAVGEVGLSLSVVTSMTLGIVVDDTVHFLSKYRRARSELGRSPPDAVRYAFVTVGRALLTTSLVLVAGFLVLSLSSFELNAGMGLLTALVIALALVADFFLLPPLLMKVEGYVDEGDPDEGIDEGTAADRAAGGRAPA